MKLIIGNKNYSSWSLRAWLVLHAFDIKFEEIKVPLFTDTAQQTLGKYIQHHHATGTVPLLEVQGSVKGNVEGNVEDNQQDNEQNNQKGRVETQSTQVIWDSLAIAEYIACHYASSAWGQHPEIARSLACEMHSGFFAVRGEMPMNIRASRKIVASAACLKDIKRIDHIFSTYRQQFAHEGDYLLGEFSIADAFYAPVVFRFATYNKHSGIGINKLSQTYCDNLLQHPSMQAWQAAALDEPQDGEWYVLEDEAGVAV